MFEFDANTRSDTAMKIIFQQLFNTLKTHEAAVIAGLDDEALHDFRIAIRRTRCGLGQFKTLFNPPPIAYFVEYFAWLGAITTPARDIDVHLQQFAQYRQNLSKSKQNDLLPLQNYLLAKQQQAHQYLSEQLKTDRYIEGLTAWMAFLNPLDNPPAPQAAIKIQASARIYKNYRRLIELGHQLDKHSPDSEWHELRKRGKKLRYLIEFFQQLYDTEDIKLLIKNLKYFQDVLGGYQDLTVQIQAWQSWLDDIKQRDTPHESIAVIEQLLSDIEHRKSKLHKPLLEALADFSTDKQQTAFKTLFKNAK